MSFENLKLQIPADRTLHHYVKVRAIRHTDGPLALFHGPSLLARHGLDGTPEGKLFQAAA